MQLPQLGSNIIGIGICLNQDAVVFPYANIPFDICKGTCPGALFGKTENILPVWQFEISDFYTGIRVM